MSEICKCINTGGKHYFRTEPHCLYFQKQFCWDSSSRFPYISVAALSHENGIPSYLNFGLFQYFKCFLFLWVMIYVFFSTGKRSKNPWFVDSCLILPHSIVSSLYQSAYFFREMINCDIGEWQEPYFFLICDLSVLRSTLGNWITLYFHREYEIPPFPPKISYWINKD